MYRTLVHRARYGAQLHIHPENVCEIVFDPCRVTAFERGVQRDVKVAGAGSDPVDHWVRFDHRKQLRLAKHISPFGVLHVCDVHTFKVVRQRLLPCAATFFAWRNASTDDLSL